MNVGDRVRIITKEFDDKLPFRQYGKLGTVVRLSFAVLDIRSNTSKDGLQVLLDDAPDILPGWDCYICYYLEHLEVIPTGMVEPDFTLDEIHHAQDVYSEITSHMR